jgi:pimeloyl-ACP methyl ester carboxylesterase
VYAIDALFHGFSSKEPWDDEGWRDMQVEGVADLIEALGYSWVHVEGESMGGEIAFELGMRYPHLCGKLILNTGTGAIDLKKTDFKENPGGGSALQELSQRSILEPSFENMRKRMEWLVADPSRMTDEMVDIRVQLYAFPEVYESIKRVYGIDREQGGWQFKPKWQEKDLLDFKPPALVFWTEDNPGEGPDFGEYISNLIPGAKFYNMEDAAHWPQWEKPEEHDQVLIDFIQGG